jgi:hypothetical protein
MPYILQIERKPYDDLISKIIAGIETATDMDIGALANEFKIIIIFNKPEAFDGEFNYFLTKLMIKLNWIDGMTYYSYLETSKKISKLVCECLTIYSTPKPSYFNYNRVIGMLTCCQLEFKRRYGNSKAALPIMFLQMIIKELYEEIGVYEDTKIANPLNGDV